MRTVCLISVAGLLSWLSACVYDPVYEGIGCSEDQECPEGYWCAGTGVGSFCTSYQPVDTGPHDPDAGDGADTQDAGADEEPQVDDDGVPDAGDPGDPGIDAADQGDPGTADDAGTPDTECQDKDRDNDGYDSILCGGDDCNDDDPTTNPGVDEGPWDAASCQDNRDNDCDGLTDADDPGCERPWWDRAFRRRRKIAFDNQSQGENLEYFPVLVTLDGGPLGRIDYSQTQDQGQDLRFVDADDSTVLDHEIESWDEGGTSYVWVKVPRIDAGSNSDYMWMYYGNTSAADGQHPAQVWSNQFRAVYHLHDDLDDSTGRYPGANQGTVNNEGQIATGQEFYANNRNSYIDLARDIDILQAVSATTLSAWVHAHYIGSENDCLIYISRPKQGLMDGFMARALMCVYGYSEVVVGGRSRDTEEFRSLNTLLNQVSLREWHYLVGVIDYSGNRISIFKNGQLVRTDWVVFSADTTSDTTSPRSTIGSHANGGDFFFDGLIDEVRVSDTVRSADWIAAQHLSMINQFLIFFGEESLD